jgi:hypothetical protein
MKINIIYSRKISIAISITLLLIFTSYASLAIPQTNTDSITTSCLIRIIDNNPQNLAQQLIQQGYDVLYNSITDQDFEAIVTPPERQKLINEGIQFEILSIGRPYVEIQQELNSGILPVPPGYLDLAEIISEMTDYANNNPSICKLYDLTDTYNQNETQEGNHLYAIKISDNVHIDENEPAFLMVSNHHAREVVTPEIALYAINEFTSEYGSDPVITDLVDEYELWICPIWNPDGYDYMYYYDNWWRKNLRDNNENGYVDDNDGVDLNRNYPFGWYSAYSGSTSPSSETYKGPSPASEPETQTMMTFSDDRHFVKVMDYHSYGREVLYAYTGWSHPFESWMQTEAIAISTAAGYGGSVRSASAMGEEYQWQIYANGSYANLMETHSEFQPSYSSGLAEAALVFPGTIYILQRPISVSGVVKDFRTNQPIVADITLEDVNFQHDEFFKSEPRFGRYHLIVPPGTYTINFSAPGYLNQTHEITVTSDSAEIKDILLQTPNTPPDPPGIHGPIRPRFGVEMTYTFWGTDYDEDELEFYVMWGDGKVKEWFGPYQSNESFELTHIYEEEGQYTIRCKSRDPSGEETDWTKYKIIVPKNLINSYNHPFLTQFPRLWKLLNFLFPI